jgi:hypothetical protein
MPASTAGSGTGNVSGDRVKRGEGSVSWELDATPPAIISVPKRGTLGFSGFVGSGGEMSEPAAGAVAAFG